MKAYLSLAGVGLFSGQYFGWTGSCSGRVAHFRANSFSPEVLTDPSYLGKLIVADFEIGEDRWPMPENCQSFMPHLAGLVFLQKPAIAENANSHFTLKNYLISNRICGFIPDQAEFLRDALGFSSDVYGAIDRERQRAEILSSSRRSNPARIDLNMIVAPQEYLWDMAPGEMPLEQINLIVWDFGLNYGMLRALRKMGCRLRVVPPSTSPEQIIALHPDGVIIAGGPLEDDILAKTTHPIERLVGIRPTLGIGSGAIMVGKALGISSTILERPHFSSTMAVEDNNGRVFATYQAHSMSVKRKSLIKAGAEITHINVSDGSIEGFSHSDFAVYGTMFSMTGEEQQTHLGAFLASVGLALDLA